MALLWPYKWYSMLHIFLLPLNPIESNMTNIYIIDKDIRLTLYDHSTEMQPLMGKTKEDRCEAWVELRFCLLGHARCPTLQSSYERHHPISQQTWKYVSMIEASDHPQGSFMIHMNIVCKQCFESHFLGTWSFLDDAKMLANRPTRYFN